MRDAKLEAMQFLLHQFVLYHMALHLDNRLVDETWCNVMPSCVLQDLVN